jgi:hypothetical protein
MKSMKRILGATIGLTIVATFAVNCPGPEKKDNTMLILGLAMMQNQAAQATPTAVVTKSATNNYSASIYGYAPQAQATTIDECKASITDMYNGVKATYDKYTECKTLSDAITPGTISNYANLLCPATWTYDATKYKRFTVANPLTEAKATLDANYTAAQLTGASMASEAESKIFIHFMMATSVPACATKIGVDNPVVLSIAYTGPVPANPKFVAVGCIYGSAATETATMKKCASLSEAF